MTGESPRRSSGGPGRSRAVSREQLALAMLAGTSGLAVALTPPDAQASAARLAIIVLGIAVAWRILGRSAATTAPSPERFDAELRQQHAHPQDIAGLRSIETDLRMSSASAFGLELRLKPLFHELAGWRLAANHGVDIDASPDAARRILGDLLWRLTRAADERPEFREPGIPLAEVRAAIDRLERI